MRRNTNLGLDRREFISGVAAGAATLGSTGVAAAGCKTHGPDLDEVADGKSKKTYYCLQKKWFFKKKFLKVKPLKGSIPVEELYGWDKTYWSSTGTRPLQREDTCITFFYEGPSGDVSLVIVHEKLTGHNDGGSATFKILGLPKDGSWIVKDDEYAGPNNYDEWETEGHLQTIHWTWTGGRNDGGVYGPLDDDLYFRIDPRFNEEAKLYGEEYDGKVDRWQLLSGRLDDPERHTLWMDEGANFFKGIFSHRDHEDYWEEKREKWDDRKDHGGHDDGGDKDGWGDGGKHDDHDDGKDGWGDGGKHDDGGGKDGWGDGGKHDDGGGKDGWGDHGDDDGKERKDDGGHAWWSDGEDDDGHGWWG